jgi:hypothetical protein
VLGLINAVNTLGQAKINMAAFILGAGATRGASFVGPAENPCLPPLDTDFYAQLQRIRNEKHKGVIEAVIQDTVDLFRTARLPRRVISSGHDANQPRSNNQATTGADID